MTGPIDIVAASEKRRRIWEDRLAGPMYFLAVLFLVVLAGVIHRYPHLSSSDLEARLIEGGLGILWFVFLVEAGIRFSLRDRSRPAWKPLLKAAIVGLLPPLRMGCRSQVRPNHVWLPWLGWQESNSRLDRTLERVFSVPMIVFALLVVPLLILEHLAAEQIRAEPILALCLDIATSVIWLAFAFELILRAGVADRPSRYCLRHWIDVAIVLMPAVEMLPLFRLLRLGRILRLEELLRWGRLHRLQTLLARGWRAFLLLQIVQRLTGRTVEGRLKQLRELMQAKEEEIAVLRGEIKELEGRTAAKVMSQKATCSTGTI